MQAGHVASTEASLDLGFSVEYLGHQAEANLPVEKEATEHTFFAYFTQKAFTVSMELPTHPEEVVSDAFTDAHLQALKDSGAISKDNTPLYISNISFELRRLMDNEKADIVENWNAS